MHISRSMLPVFLFLIISFSAHSQQWRDYIVNFKNDTIYGRLVYTLRMASRFETDSGAAYSVSTTSIESYYSAVHQALYRRRSLPGKKRFSMLRCLEAGSISLYGNYSSHYSGPNSGYANNPTITFYAEKENNKLVEIWTNRGIFGSNTNKTQREALVAMIEDNPAVKELMEKDTKYEDGDAQYYVHEYNKGVAAK